MPERRTGKLDTGQRRRQEDRYEEFVLHRDRFLLAVGTVIVVGIGIASVFGHIDNTSIALAVLAVGGTLLGAPTVLRLDESSRRRKR